MFAHLVSAVSAQSKLDTPSTANSFTKGLISSLAALSLGSLTVLATVSAHAEQLPVDPDARLTLGINAIYSMPAYDVDNSVLVLPQAFYDNNRWYLEGGEAGGYLYKDEDDQVRLGVIYEGQSFDPDDADAPLDSLDEREWSVMALASYMRITPYGGLKARAETDLLDRNNGTKVTFSHLSKFTHNDFTFYPEFGVQWFDDNYNDYYYGISNDEVERSDSTELEAYDSDSGFSPFARVTASYRVNDHWSVFGYQKFEYLADEQSDSPMVDENWESVSRIGVNYKF